MCHNGANRTERGARGSESAIGAAAQALVQGSAWGFVRGSARGYARVCGGMQRRRVRWNRAGCGTTAGGVLRGGSVAAGGLSGWRADGAQRRTGWRDEGVRGWWLWRVADGLLRGSCGTAAVGWPVVEAVGCRPGRRLRGLAAGVVASGKECFGGRNAWGLPVLLRYGAADGCGGVDRKAGFLSPGRAIEMESRRGTAAERAVVMKGCGSGRGGCREPTAGIAVWMV